MLKILKGSLPRQVSFSLYWGMRDCILSGLPNSSFEAHVCERVGRDSKAPMVLGIFFHELMSSVGARVNSNEDQKAALAMEFPLLVQDFETRFPDIDLEYQPIVSTIHKTINEHFDFAEYAGSNLVFEDRITSEETQLFGQPDLLVIDEATVTIVDFKLTSNQERLGHEKNEAQLHFYAHLVEKKYGHLPSSAELVGLSGARLPVSISRADVEQVVADAQYIQHTLREFTYPEADCRTLANPMPGVCVTCDLRDCCPVSAA